MENERGKISVKTIIGIILIIAVIIVESMVFKKIGNKQIKGVDEKNNIKETENIINEYLEGENGEI